MRTTAFKVAAAVTPLLVAPAVADGIPGYNGPAYTPEPQPYERVEPRTIAPPVVVERPIVVVPRVVVRRPIIVERPIAVEPPVIVSRPSVVVEPRVFAYRPGPPIFRLGPGRRFGHFRHGY
jgi:hypothetical protein